MGGILSNDGRNERCDVPTTAETKKPQTGEEAMLVLTRKRDEFIKIGSNIVIRVIKTGNGSVKIGIDAPASVRVMRGELATNDEPDMTDAFAHHDEALLEDALLEAMMFQS
jgi:carbon storage regulator